MNILPIAGNAQRSVERSKLLTLDQKKELLLIAGGIKPATFQEFGEFANRRSAARLERRSDHFMEQARRLGVCVAASDIAQVTLGGRVNLLRYAYVARTPDQLYAVQKAFVGYDFQGQGRAVGYPERAVEAYADSAHDGIVSACEVDGLDPVAARIGGFMLSRNHAAEDFAVAQQWAAALRTISPVVYGAFERQSH